MVLEVRSSASHRLPCVVSARLLPLCVIEDVVPLPITRKALLS